MFALGVNCTAESHTRYGLYGEKETGCVNLGDGEGRCGAEGAGEERVGKHSLPFAREEDF